MTTRHSDRSRQTRILERLAVNPRGAHAGGLPGRRPGRGLGTSAEFVDYRDYSPGDDVRYVDWNVHARLRRLLTKQYRAESELDVHLLLDSSASMAFGKIPKIDKARELVLALAFVGLNSLDRVGFSTFDTHLHQRTVPQRGKPQLGLIRRALEGLCPKGATDFDGAMHAHAVGAARPGLALIISDFYDVAGYRHGIERLLYHRFDVVVVQLVADEELTPKLRPGDYIRDLEDPGGNPRPVRHREIERYRREVRQWNRVLAGFCARHGVRHVCIRSSDPFERVVERLLETRVWQRR